MLHAYYKESFNMSDDVVIRVENLSKQYRIGGAKEGYRTFRETLVDAAKTPFLRAQEAWSMAHRAWSKSINSKLPAPRSQLSAPSFPHTEGTSALSAPRSMHAEGTSSLPAPGSSLSSTDDTIWALKDVSFEVKRGEVVGIIGRNGAGKSTLLKILSKITEPTKGRVELRGRVGSLLEVGTGFHPELTGHENVYLYGAILGMDRWEVTRKFDEIVAFAELEKFIETPVKRYSTGMYMRLAFAVAAHMETEILLVDEVLAVGDAAFQKKSLGKMGDAASQGRTVLFVSHNLGAVNQLCERTILLENGKIIADGYSQDIVNAYLSSLDSEITNRGELTWDSADQAPDCEEIRLGSVQLLNYKGKTINTFKVNEPIYVRVTYQVKKILRGMRIVFLLSTQEGEVAFASTDQNMRQAELDPGHYRSVIRIPENLLNTRKYYLQLHFGIPGIKILIPKREYLSFTCVGSTKHGSHFTEKWPGVVAPAVEWSIEQLDDENNNKSSR